MQEPQTTLEKTTGWGQQTKPLNQNASSEQSFKEAIAPMAGIRTETITKYYGGNEE